MNRVLLILPLLLLAVVAGGAVAAWQLGYITIGTPAAQAAEYSPDTAVPSMLLRRRAPLGGDGVMYETRERVVNLADPGGSRYLKASVVFEIYRPVGRPGEATPADYARAKEELAEELAPLAPAIEDMITTVLTAKTSAELVTPDGKAQLKQELKDQFNRLIDSDRVLAVYLTQFIIQ